MVRGKQRISLTVHSNGNGLGEGETISTNKRRDASETVDLQVFCADTFGRAGVDNLEINIVGLCNGKNDVGAAVALYFLRISRSHQLSHESYLERVQLSERHLCGLMSG